MYVLILVHLVVVVALSLLEVAALVDQWVVACAPEVEEVAHEEDNECR